MPTRLAPEAVRAGRVFLQDRQPVPSPGKEQQGHRGSRDRERSQPRPGPQPQPGERIGDEEAERKAKKPEAEGWRNPRESVSSRRDEASRQTLTGRDDHKPQRRG